MKGDFTRNTFRKHKHYTRVLQQQGRVQLDADWNEQGDIEAHLRETGVRDVVGPSGAPMDGGGFQIEATTGSGLAISPGRFYVDGFLGELAAGLELPLGVLTVVPSSPPASPTFQIAEADLRRLGLAAGGAVKVLSQDAFGRELARGPFSVLSVGPVVAGKSLVVIAGLDVLFPNTTPPRLRRETTYLQQTDFPGAAYPSTDGAYLAYLDVWPRHLTWLDDPEIREPALGGPDTATRVKTVFQVRLLWLGEAAEVDFQERLLSCSSKPELWNAETARGSGRLRARAQPGTVAPDPCIVPDQAGFTGLENQLYRVEIHDGSSNPATFKWSRENGSVVTWWLDVPVTGTIRVADPGRDAVHAFHEKDWVELIAADAEADGGLHGVMVQLGPVEGDLLTIPTTPSSPPSQIEVWIQAFEDARKNQTAPPRIKVRRWDGVAGARSVKAGPTDTIDGWIPLENGVQVRFEEGTFKTGDYWMIPARTFNDSFGPGIEWPQDAQKNALALPPHGIEHHHCKLAVVVRSGGAWSVRSDCRDLFPPLTGMLHLEKLCGDCQEALPGETLNESLRLAVLNGGLPMPGKVVHLAVTNGGGSLSELLGSTQVSSLDLTTGLDGTVDCYWTLGAGYDHQHVEARFLDEGGNWFGPALCFEARQIVPHLQVLCGNGQQARPNQPLPQALSVRVTAGELHPLPQWQVRFQIREGGGFLQPATTGGITLDEEFHSLEGVTDADGIAHMLWVLGAAPAQHLEATLLFLVAGALQPLGPPVCFTATLSVASQVAYAPGACDLLGKESTVQGALDTLCGNVSISYVGGDGQEGDPGKPLPRPLEVRVSNGSAPLKGALIQFTIVKDGGSGQLSPDGSVANAQATLPPIQTGADGLASCFWFLDDKTPSQRVEAALLKAGSAVTGQVIHFNASLRQQPGDQGGVKVRKVQSADGRFPLDNDTFIPISRFVAGFRVVCSEDLADFFQTQLGLDPTAAKPNVMAELYLPYPLVGDRSAWGGFIQTVGYQPLLLAGQVSLLDEANKNIIVWRPGAPTKQWLTGIFPNIFRFNNDNTTSFRVADHLLAKIILKGNFIWSASNPDKFLDGEVFGQAGTATVGNPAATVTSTTVRTTTVPRIDLNFSATGDGRRGGDFEMWFWLFPAIILDCQVSGTQVFGFLRDATGSGMPGVTVTLTSKANTFTNVTGANGDFRFQAPSGFYTAQAAGVDASPVDLVLGTPVPTPPVKLDTASTQAVSPTKISPVPESIPETEAAKPSTTAKKKPKAAKPLPKPKPKK
jgi:hypothetical protein